MALEKVHKVVMLSVPFTKGSLKVSTHEDHFSILVKERLKTEPCMTHVLSVEIKHQCLLTQVYLLALYSLKSNESLCYKVGP